MRDTPRMDAATKAAIEHGTDDVWFEGMKLERELNAMTRERDEAIAAATLHREKFGASRMAYDAAERRNADLLARIKRLEESGDSMMSKPCVHTFVQWIKSKEAKP